MIGSAYSEIHEALAAGDAVDLSELVEAVRDKNILLLDAAYALDLPVIRAALAAGADPNARAGSMDARGAETPLHRAVRGNGEIPFEDVAHALLGAGADPLARNSAGDTPLHAAMYEREDRAMTLVRLGIDPLVLDDAAQPLIIKATLLNMLQLVELLIHVGVPVDVRDEKGQTALIVATREGRAAAVKFLLAHGADPNAADNRSYSAKRIAMESEDAQLELIFNPPNTTAVQTNAPVKPKSGCAINSAVLMLLALTLLALWIR
jgi:ankyrin repeat protein